MKQPDEVAYDQNSNFDYEAWHVTWAGGDADGFQAAQPPADLIAAYPYGTDPLTGYLSMYLVVGHLSGYDYNLLTTDPAGQSVMVMNFLTDTGQWDAYGLAPGVLPAGDYTVVTQHQGSGPGSEGTYVPNMIPGMTLLAQDSTAPDPYYASTDPSLDINDPGTAILMGHTGTLMTDGQGNGDVDRAITRDGYTVTLGPDVSAAAINPALDAPDPLNLPDGYIAAPVYDGPIY